MSHIDIAKMTKAELKALPAYERLMLVAEPYKPCGGVWIPPMSQRKVHSHGWLRGSQANEYFRIHDQSKGKVVTGTRVVWEHHNGPAPEGMVICHKCDNPPCLEITHLFIGTQQDNARDMAKKRRQKHAPFPKGERHPNSKLTDEDVLDIFTDDRPRTQIARDYGVGADAIRYIQEGINWRHVTFEEPIEEGKYGSLTEAQVKELYCDTRTQEELVQAYGISRVAIYKIKSGRSWRKVTRGLKRG